jgi:hypothetical protein
MRGWLTLPSEVAVVVEPAHGAYGDGRHDLFQIEAGRGSVFQRAFCVRQEQCIRNDDVPMNVQIEARSKRPAEGDGGARGLLEAERASPLLLPALDLSNEDATDAESASTGLVFARSGFRHRRQRMTTCVVPLYRGGEFCPTPRGDVGMMRLWRREAFGYAPRSGIEWRSGECVCPSSIALCISPSPAFGAGAGF